MWFLLEMKITPLFLSILRVPFLGGRISDNSNSVNDIDYTVISEFEYDRLRLFREIIEEELVREYQRSDDFLIRWLRECELNIYSAATMLRKALTWRKENDMDSIMNKTFLSMKNQVCFLSGFDNNGGPVLIFQVPTIDLRKLIYSGHIQNISHHMDQCLERYTQASIHGGPFSKEIRMSPGTIIIDVHGFTVKQHACFGCVRLYKQLTENSNNFYPRASKLVVIINAPTFARPLVEIMKPVMPRHIQKTLEVFGSDRVEWTKFLLSVIPKDQLLQEFGGVKLKNV